MKTFQEKIEALRQELIQSIAGILKRNHLQEIELSDDEEYDITYVVWFDDDGNIYDSRVTKVSLYEDGICLEVFDDCEGVSSTLYHFDLACQHLDWLDGLRKNILETIKLQQNAD